MYNLIEKSDNHSKESGILWQYWRDKQAVNAKGDVDDFNAANATTNSFNLKAKITGQTGDNGKKIMK